MIRSAMFRKIKPTFLVQSFDLAQVVSDVLRFDLQLSMRPAAAYDCDDCSGPNRRGG